MWFLRLVLMRWSGWGGCRCLRRAGVSPPNHWPGNAHPLREPPSPATVARVTHAGNEITAELIRDLLRDQHPDLAGRPLTLGARGWDNQLWRLGDDLAVRLPWATQDADALLHKEYSLLPAVAPRLPLQIPVPQRL